MIKKQIEIMKLHKSFNLTKVKKILNSSNDSHKILKDLCKYDDILENNTRVENFDILYRPKKKGISPQDFITENLKNGKSYNEIESLFTGKPFFWHDITKIKAVIEYYRRIKNE